VSSTSRSGAAALTGMTVQSAMRQARNKTMASTLLPHTTAMLERRGNVRAKARACAQNSLKVSARRKGASSTMHSACPRNLQTARKS